VVARRGGVAEHNHEPVLQSAVAGYMITLQKLCRSTARFGVEIFKYGNKANDRVYETYTILDTHVTSAVPLNGNRRVIAFLYGAVQIDVIM
jgi:hypothetical protein